MSTADLDALFASLYLSVIGHQDVSSVLRDLGRRLQCASLALVNIDAVTHALRSLVIPDARSADFWLDWLHAPRNQALLSGELLALAPGQVHQRTAQKGESPDWCQPGSDASPIANVSSFHALKISSDAEQQAYLLLFQSAPPPIARLTASVLPRIGYHFSRRREIEQFVCRLVDNASVGSALLEFSSRPTLLIDARLKVLQASHAVDRIAASHTLFSIDSGTLEFQNRENLARLRAALTALSSGQALTSAPQRSFCHLTDATGRNIPVGLWFLRSWSALPALAGVPRFLMVLPATLSSHEPDPVLLEAAFDLTPAESRICSLIARGLSVSRCAVQLRLSEHTVRNHLKSIFLKTDTRSQRELETSIRTLLG